MRLSTPHLLGLLGLIVPTLDADLARAYEPLDGNTGYVNTGYVNTGYVNTGYVNTGYVNTGYSNTGYVNTGYVNTGYVNTGYVNTGYVNTGYVNGGSTNSTLIRARGGVAVGQWSHVGYLPVKAGSTFTVIMVGSGDADLYVKFGSEPNASSFDCRPYFWYSYESCSVTVPSGAERAYVSVHGYDNATFDLDIKGYDVALDRMKTSQDQVIDNVALSGTAFTGSANWTSYTGWWECEAPYGCWWVTGEHTSYRALAPQDFVGAVMQATVVSGETASTIGMVATRINSIQQGSGYDSDVYTYGVDVFLRNNDNTGSWLPLCGLDAQGVAYRAIPLQGGWNYQQGTLGGGSKISNSANHITWACMNGALGKCAAGHSITNGLGYKPWVPQNVFYKKRTYKCPSGCVCYWDTEWVVQASTGASAHQACTRLITADYCGDGKPHTVTGRSIDVWDMLPSAVNYKGYNTFEAGAAWKSNGADDFGCYPSTRVGALWPRWCADEDDVYCEDKCPTYATANGGSFTHVFNVGDDGSWRCNQASAFAGDETEPGTTFNRNTIVNTHSAEGTVRDAPYPIVIRR